ncbi:MAG: glycosyltransferase, partial [Pseudomonadota bacterium]|nr:glycosyltransferase [Pseudomonadota bacterium]
MIDAAASSSPLVSVLIVNYNSGPNLARCLAALADQTMDDFEVIVVDNGSADRSVALIARAPTALTLDLAGGNLGFAAGINRAAGQARGRWLALLNPDAFAAPGWLAALLSASGRYPAQVMFASLQRQEAAPACLDGAGDP